MSLHIDQIIRFALDKSKQNDLSSIAYANIDWILDNLYYVTKHNENIDIYNNLRDPEKTLDYGVGVCEDYTLLLEKMFHVQGIPSRIVVVSYPAKNPEYSEHAYIEVFDGKEWFIVDATLYNSNDNKNITLYDGKKLLVSKPLSREILPEAVWMPFLNLERFDRGEFVFKQGLNINSREYILPEGSKLEQIEID